MSEEKEMLLVGLFMFPLSAMFLWGALLGVIDVIGTWCWNFIDDGEALKGKDTFLSVTLEKIFPNSDSTNILIYSIISSGVIAFIATLFQLVPAFTVTLAVILSITLVILLVARMTRRQQKILKNHMNDDTIHDNGEPQ